MDDLISRQDAIDALDEQFWRCLNIPICKEIRNVAKETIKALPSAQQKPQWIPCSERLPEENGRYLVTNGNWGANQIDINIWMSELGGWVSNDKPIAWMPLPPSYKGRKDGD